jgi:mRNA-degrading endonuclease YafQ of YafQ-DinJ toxin-antitoxin module
MNAGFLVATTSRFDRELKKLTAKHPGVVDVFGKAIKILKADPYNSSRQYPIKKLEGVPAGEGQ